MAGRRILSLWFPRLQAERVLRLRRDALPVPLAVVADRNGAQVLVSLAQMPLVLVGWWWLGGRDDHATPVSLHTATDALVPVMAVVVLGVVGTGLAQSMQFDVVRAAGPTVATSVTYLIPVVSVALGVVVLGESLGPVVFLGAAVVLAASLLIGRAPRPRVRAAVSVPYAKMDR